MNQAMKDRIRESFWAKIALILGVFVVLGLIYALCISQSNRIYPGVRVGKVDVGFMTKNQAREKLRENLDGNLDKPLEMHYKNGQYKTTLRDLGYHYDIDKMVKDAYKTGRTGHPGEDFLAIFHSLVKKPNPVLGGFQGSDLSAYLYEVSKDLYIESKDADLMLVDGKVHLSEDQPGQYLDAPATKKALENWNGTSPIDLPVIAFEAKVQKSMLKDLDGVLGEFTTTYGSSEKNRKFNIALGAEKLNQKVIQPGEEVSFNDVMDQITKEAGFKVSGVIKNGSFDRGVGGGICQVSTTLYNALLQADVTIVERHNHSRPIGYVKNGTDAAVATGHKNLVFKNDYQHPLYIKSQADGEKLTFQVLGHGADKDYEIEILPELVSTQRPRTKTIYTDSLSSGVTEVKESGHNGYSYRTYKKVMKNGELVEKKQISTSNYISQDRLVYVGTGGGSSEEDEE